MKAKQHNSTIQPQKHLSPWMTTEQAAEYMCCNPITVRRWRTEGKGPRFVTVNRHTIRYHIDEIEAFLKSAGGKL
ncbi:MAG: helix-turn-helix domain-containing protein [Alphaproteobacteria bacterium]